MCLLDYFDTCACNAMITYIQKIHMYVCTYVCMYVCIHMMCLCVYVCLCVLCVCYVHVCVCACVCTTNHYRWIIASLVKTEPLRRAIMIIQNTGEYFCGFSKSFTAPPYQLHPLVIPSMSFVIVVDTSKKEPIISHLLTNSSKLHY